MSPLPERGGDPLARVTWPVRSERLVIRRARPEDAEATWRFRRLPEVTEWLPSAPATAAEHASRYTQPERLRRFLVAEHAGVVVADLKLDVVDGWAQEEMAHRARGVEAEIGWTLDPAYGGRGLATEAVSCLLEVCFVDLGLRRVVGHCFADNLASRRLMERVGMRREAHTVRDSLHRSGSWLDGMSYAILAEEHLDRAGPHRVQPSG